VPTQFKSFFFQKLIYIQNKWLIVVIVSLIALIIGGIYSYPKTELTMAVHTHYLELIDKDGQIKSEYRDNELYKIQNHLKQSGIKLNLKAQESNENEKAVLEFLISNPHQLDFTKYLNLGNKLPANITSEFNSIGIVGLIPYFFLVRTNQSDIQSLKDLKGKKIAFWTSPEGSKNPVFSKGGDKASPYSDDLILEQIFNLAGVTAENSQLMNVWPTKLSYQQDWDVMILQFEHPSKNDSNIISNDLYPALMSNKIRFLELDDLESVAKRLPHLKIAYFPKSVLEPDEGIPNVNLKTIAATQSYFVRKDLDPSLVIILSDALKQNYSQPRILAQKDEYPNFSSIETFAPHPVAEKFYREGNDTLLHHYFSPTFAAFIKKLLLILGPIFLIIYPISHFAPLILRAYCKYKIALWYREIYFIEASLDKSVPQDFPELRSHLEQLEKDLKEFKLPLIHNQFVQEIFIVREHIDLIKQKMHLS